jgi:hypothetical protein
MTQANDLRGGTDRNRIDIHEPQQLHYWSDRFGVTAEKLRKAVDAVGVRADKVQEFLEVKSFLDSQSLQLP